MAPSLRSLCVIASLLSATFASVTPRGQKQATLPLYELGASNNGSAALPTPTVAAKYIALGIGFQNYTCVANSTTGALSFVQSQPSDGAVAHLYDVTKNVNSCNVDYITSEALNAFEICLAKSQCYTNKPGWNCDQCYQFAIAYVRSRGIAPAPQVGLHYFTDNNGTQTPNFNLHGDFLSAKKVGDVKAPSNSSTGSAGLGAVDWLYLKNNGNGQSHGLSAVYRVETAGGAAPRCSSVGDTTSQPYSAEYWFYA